MAEKKVQLITFMTSIDEANFSASLMQRFRSLTFIDSTSWPTPPPPPQRNSIHECASSIVVLLNQDILSFEEYCSKYVAKHPSGVGYHGAGIGRGLIQFLRSQEVSGHLKDGRLAATYDPADAPMSAYVKGVWTVFKERSRKVYLINRETGEVAAKAETKFFAWPDAAEKYNGRDGHYLMHSAFHYFVAK
jgi:hypothetical protein